MKYRLLAFLTAAMLMSQGFITSSASAETDSADSHAVRFLSALGIMSVDSDTNMFWDNTPVERAEIAEILCDMFGFEATEDAKPRFEDVTKEDRAYVETIVRNGYMTGYSDSRFGPLDYVTREQLIKIFVTVLDGDKMAEALGGFPSGYVAVAKRIDLLNGTVNGNLSDNATRIEAANMIYAALHIDMPALVGISNDESIYDFTEGETFLTERLDIYRYEGTVTANEATALYSDVGLGDGYVKVGDELCTDVNGVANDFLGYAAEVYVRKSEVNAPGEIIYIEEARENTVIVMEDDDKIEVSGFDVSYYDGDKRKTLTMNSLVYMIYNGKAKKYDESLLTPELGSVKFIDNNGDKKYDVVSVTDFDTYVSDGVRDDEAIMLKFNEGSLKLGDHYVSVYRDGERIELSDIGIGDVLLVAASETAERNMVYRIDVCSGYAMGTIEKSFTTDDGEFVTMGGQDYKIGAYFRKLVASNQMSEVKPGQSGRLFLDSRGNIVYSNMNTMTQSVGYLVNSAIIDNVFTSSLKIRIYTMDGIIEEFGTGDKLSVNGSNMEVSKITSDSMLAEKFKKPELVEYSTADGIIKRIDFPGDGYDLQRFSKDANGNFKCTSTSILDFKYNVTSSTIVFRVPKLSERNPMYDSIMNDTSYYKMASGSYFGRGNWYNNTKIYDVGTDCEVKYVVIEYSPDSSEIWETHPVLAIDSVGDGIDSEGNEIKIISGYNENGELVEFKTGINIEKATYDSTLKRRIKPGDVVQYRTDSNGRLVETKLQHSADAAEYYTPVALEEWRTDYSVFRAYGEVISGGGTKILLACKSVWEGMSPLDTDVLVSNTGNAVLCFDSTKNKLVNIDFDEIERGDKMLVCMNTSNYARMIVVYE